MGDCLEILLATMNQSDFSIIKRMNVKTDIIIANQSGWFDYKEYEFDGHKAKLVTTNTKGISKNREIALMYATGNILLLADDDVKYTDDYEQKILNAFSELPQADVIIFSVNISRGGQLYPDKNRFTKRLHIFNALSYGSYRIAFRKKTIMAKNIHFSHVLGTGSGYYSSGEDSLFLLDCLKRGLKVFHHKDLIGITNKDSSTWFDGYNEKFFYEKGAVVAALFGKLKYLLLAYYIWRFRKESTLTAKEKWKLMSAGYKGYSKLITYGAWKNA